MFSIGGSKVNGCPAGGYDLSTALGTKKKKVSADIYIVASPKMVWFISFAAVRKMPRVEDVSETTAAAEC